MTLNVYIGYDSREPIIYEVCKHTLLQHASIPINVIPLKHQQLRRDGFYRRTAHINPTTGHMLDSIDNRPFSTEFTYTRFLVPMLNGYEGWAVFMDSDMIFKGDIKELLKHCEDKYSALVVKHNHKPANEEKMDGQAQSSYPCKNWSSFILFNCAHSDCRILTAEKVSYATGAWLHRFQWASPHHIGALPHEWNWIYGSSPANMKPNVIHYTEGGPWFDECQDVPHSDDWWKAYDRYMNDAPDKAMYVPKRKK